MMISIGNKSVFFIAEAVKYTIKALEYNIADHNEPIKTLTI